MSGILDAKYNDFLDGNNNTFLEYWTDFIRSSAAIQM